MKSFPKHFKVDLHSGRQVGVAFRGKRGGKEVLYFVLTGWSSGAAKKKNILLASQLGATPSHFRAREARVEGLALTI